MLTSLATVGFSVAALEAGAWADVQSIEAHPVATSRDPVAFCSDLRSNRSGAYAYLPCRQLGLTCRWFGARNQAAMRRLPVIHLPVAVNDRLSLQATAGFGHHLPLGLPD